MAKSNILKHLINELGLKIYKFEHEIGVGKSAIEKAIDRNSEISDKTIQKIVGRYPAVSRNWLLTGEGSMLNAGYESPSDSHTPVENINQSTGMVKEPEINEIRRQHKPTEKKRVPLFDAYAAAGNNYPIELAPVYEPVQHIELGELLSNDSQAALYVFGSSMVPSYPSGCVVGLRQNLDGIIMPGEVYVLETDSNRMLKRLYNTDDMCGYKCYSDNTMMYESGPMKGQYAYPVFEVKKESVRRLFDVTGMIKRNRNSAVMAKAG